MDLNRAIEQLLSVVVERKASDLFITAGWPPSVKIDGVSLVHDDAHRGRRP